MKKLLTVVLLLLTFLVSAQKKYDLKTKFEENTTYNNTSIVTSNIIINMDADQEMLDQMASSGQSFPMEVVSDINTLMKSTTGKRDSEGFLPVVFEYEDIESKMMMGGNEMSQPNPLKGAKIHAKYDKENKLKVDSLSGNNMQLQSMIGTLTKSLESSPTSIAFPEKGLKKGESFTQIVPFEVPMQGMKPIKLNTESVYTLKDVKRNIAYLDVKQIIKIDTTVQQVGVDGSGTGEGNLEFDMKNGYVTKVNLLVPMKITAQMNDMMTMKLDIKADTKVTVTIE